MQKLLNADDYCRQARRVLPRGLFEYIDRGTEDEIALTRLRGSLDAITLSPSVLRGQDERHLGATLLDAPVSAPIVVAPTALAGLVSRDGETKLARAASAVGIPFCVSTQSVTTIEVIRAGAPDAQLWFQLYVWRDRDLTNRLLERVAGCGCSCLVVTADTPIAPNREYNQRNGFSVPFVPSLRGTLDVMMHPRWLATVLLPELAKGGMPVYGHYPEQFRGSIMSPRFDEPVRLESRLNWDDIRALRDKWRGTLMIKGVLSVEDAKLAEEVGAEAIVVSAHGGRNLDCLPAPVDVLPGIAEEIGGRLTVLADSGIRRGTDVLKYLASGADAVMLGRLPLWGLAAEGEEGAEAVLRMILREMDSAMAFLGVVKTEETRGRTQSKSRVYDAVQET